MNKKLFLLILSLSFVTVHAEEQTIKAQTTQSADHSDAKPQTFATTATRTVLSGCQSLAMLVMASGAWKMLAADTYTNVRYKINPRNIDGVFLYFDYDTITTEHTYAGEMAQGAAAIVIGYLLYAGFNLLEKKIAYEEPCCTPDEAATADVIEATPS